MSQPGQPPKYVTDSLASVPPPAPIQVGSNGSSGGYKFDPDQVQGVITKWQNLLDNQNRFAYFEPTTVDGYPGVYVEPTDDRSNGSCSLWVGVTDQLVVDVSVQLLRGPNAAHPCDSANKIATAMIEHLRGAA